MRIADMADMDSHKAGKTTKVCRGWHYVDGYEANGSPDVLVRHVYHYGVLMAAITRVNGPVLSDGFHPYSVGIGSVSDQNGMNALLQRLGVPLRYRRNGGRARYVVWFGDQTLEGGE